MTMQTDVLITEWNPSLLDPSPSERQFVVTVSDATGMSMAEQVLAAFNAVHADGYIADSGETWGHIDSTSRPIAWQYAVRPAAGRVVTAIEVLVDLGGDRDIDDLEVYRFVPGTTEDQIVEWLEQVEFIDHERPENSVFAEQIREMIYSIKPIYCTLLIDTVKDR